MYRQGKRIGLAWLLLSVFVSMLLLSGLHRHESVASVVVDCADCAHHVHHSGHITSLADHMADCLLCQFLSLVYTAEAVAVLVPLVMFEQNRRFLLNSRIIQKESSVLFTRGPPFVLSFPER